MFTVAAVMSVIKSNPQIVIPLSIGMEKVRCPIELCEAIIYQSIIYYVDST